MQRRKARELTRRKSSFDSLALPGKLVDCQEIQELAEILLSKVILQAELTKGGGKKILKNTQFGENA